MKKYKISIPKPCHEDWSKMTPNEKGRFCSSCAKTVVDFTKKSANEIQEFFKENQGKNVCGHFKRKQLDSIVIQIPENVFHQQLSFQKIFILTLLLVMGSTLFSCKKEQGKPQKIEKVELIDSIIKTEEIIDTISTTQTHKIPPKLIPVLHKQNHTLTGLPVVHPKKSSCSKKIEHEKIIKIDSVLSVPTNIVNGGIMIHDIQGDIEITESHPISFGIVEVPPKFKGTKITKKDKLQKDFKLKINKYIHKNFDESIYNSLGLSKGKKRIFTQFTIDSLGYITDIKIRAPHQKLKEHTKEILLKLPHFIPGQQNNKKVNVQYTFPITFNVQ